VDLNLFFWSRFLDRFKPIFSGVVSWIDLSYFIIVNSTLRRGVELRIMR